MAELYGSMRATISPWRKRWWCSKIDAVLYSSGPSLSLSLSLDGRRRVRVSTCIPVQWVYRC